MTFIKKLSITMITFVAILGLTACSDDKAENAGDKVGDMADDAGNAVEDACEKVKEGVNAKDTDC